MVRSINLPLVLAAAALMACAPSGGAAEEVDANAGGGLLVPGTGGGAPDLAACSTASVEAEVVPVTFLFLIDRSGSMKEASRWTKTREAFKGFFESSENSGLQVALRMWPAPLPEGADPDSYEAICDPELYAKPTVDVGPLSSDMHRTSLLNAFDTIEPSGDTPMSAALEGAVAWADARIKAGSEPEQPVIVLMTDGQPTSCNTNILKIAEMAETLHETSGVPTYAVGLHGAWEETIDAIAKAGGTTEGFFVDDGDVESELKATLQSINRQRLSCELTIPASTSSDAIDFERVNVVLSIGGKDETLSNVPSSSSCGEGLSWYYDNPSAPTRIQLCPAACTGAQNRKEAKLDVVLGCLTIPA